MQFLLFVQKPSKLYSKKTFIFVYLCQILQENFLSAVFNKSLYFIFKVILLIFRFILEVIRILQKKIFGIICGITKYIFVSAIIKEDYLFNNILRPIEQSSIEKSSKKGSNT